MWQAFSSFHAAFILELRHLSGLLALWEPSAGVSWSVGVLWGSATKCHEQGAVGFIQATCADCTAVERLSMCLSGRGPKARTPMI